MPNFVWPGRETGNQFGVALAYVLCGGLPFWPPQPVVLTSTCEYIYLWNRLFHTMIK